MSVSKIYEDLIKVALMSPFHSIREEALLKVKQFPYLREGQAIYNLAVGLYPKSVKAVPLENDCFYDDKNIEIFLESLEKNIKKLFSIE